MNSEIKQFLTILNVILILSLLGISICKHFTTSQLIVSLYLSSWIAKFFSFLLYKVRSLQSCILYAQNNVKLHQSSNNRLVLLNTLSLTFIIFASCLLKLQANTLYANIQLTIPSDIFISSSSSALDEQAITSFLTLPTNAELIHHFLFLAKSPPSLSPSITASHSLTTYANYVQTSPTVTFLTKDYLEMV